MKAASKRKPSPPSLRQQIYTAASRGFPFYVYTLADAQGVFYVGKGKGDRVFAHGRVAGDRNARKLVRIEAGSVSRAVDSFFSCEKAAYAHEAALIREGKAHLTNIAHSSRVHPRQAAVEHAQIMLKRLVPFEKWKLPTWAKFPFLGFETPRDLYDSWVREVQGLIEQPAPTELHVFPSGAGALVYP